MLKKSGCPMRAGPGLPYSPLYSQRLAKWHTASYSIWTRLDWWKQIQNWVFWLLAQGSVHPTSAVATWLSPSCQLIPCHLNCASTSNHSFLWQAIFLPQDWTQVLIHCLVMKHTFPPFSNYRGTNIFLSKKKKRWKYILLRVIERREWALTF